MTIKCAFLYRVQFYSHALHRLDKTLTKQTRPELETMPGKNTFENRLPYPPHFF